MKIEDRVTNYMHLLFVESAKPAASVKGKESLQATPVSNADKVTISPTAARMFEEEVRRERLNEVRKQLSEGTYNISGRDVADKIIKLLKS